MIGSILSNILLITGIIMILFSILELICIFIYRKNDKEMLIQLKNRCELLFVMGIAWYLSGGNLITLSKSIPPDDFIILENSERNYSINLIFGINFIFIVLVAWVIEYLIVKKIMEKQMMMKELILMIYI